jgi:hypothetical protein
MCAQTRYLRVVIFCVVSLLLVSCGSGASQDVPGDLVGGEIGLRLVPVTDRVGIDEVGDVEIHLDNVHNLYGLHLSLQFDPTMLRVQDGDLAQDGVQIVPGDLPAPDFAVRNVTDNERGTIEYAVVQLGPREPAEGSGVVATIRFQGVKKGNTRLTFLQTKLADPDGQELPVNAVSVELEVN